MSAVSKEEDRSAFRSRFLFLARDRIVINRTCALPTQLLRLCGVAALRVGYENNTCPCKKSVKSVQIQMPFRSWMLLPPFGRLICSCRRVCIYFHSLSENAGHLTPVKSLEDILPSTNVTDHAPDMPTDHTQNDTSPLSPLITTTEIQPSSPSSLDNHHHDDHHHDDHHQDDRHHDDRNKQPQVQDEEKGEGSSQVPPLPMKIKKLSKKEKRFQLSHDTGAYCELSTIDPIVAAKSDLGKNLRLNPIGPAFVSSGVSPEQREAGVTITSHNGPSPPVAKRPQSHNGGDYLGSYYVLEVGNFNNESPSEGTPGHMMMRVPEGEGGRGAGDKTREPEEKISQGGRGAGDKTREPEEKISQGCRGAGDRIGELEREVPDKMEKPERKIEGAQGADNKMGGPEGSHRGSSDGMGDIPAAYYMIDMNHIENENKSLKRRSHRHNDDSSSSSTNCEIPEDSTPSLSHPLSTSSSRQRQRQSLYQNIEIKPVKTPNYVNIPSRRCHERQKSSPLVISGPSSGMDSEGRGVEDHGETTVVRRMSSSLPSHSSCVTGDIARQRLIAATALSSSSLVGVSHDMSHDVSHDLSHGATHDVSHDMSHDVSHDLSHGATHDVSHDSSHDDVLHHSSHDMSHDLHSPVDGERGLYVPRF